MQLLDNLAQSSAVIQLAAARTDQEFVDDT